MLGLVFSSYHVSPRAKTQTWQLVPLSTVILLEVGCVFVYLYIVYVCGHVEVRGQFRKVDFVLLQCKFRRLNSDFHVWQQAFTHRAILLV